MPVQSHIFDRKHLGRVDNDVKVFYVDLKAHENE